MAIGLRCDLADRRVLRELKALIGAEGLLPEMLVTLVVSLVRDSEGRGSLMSRRSAGGNALGRVFFGGLPEACMGDEDVSFRERESQSASNELPRCAVLVALL